VPQKLSHSLLGSIGNTILVSNGPMSSSSDWQSSRRDFAQRLKRVFYVSPAAGVRLLTDLVEETY
jgi:hypothetical protein